MSETVTVPRLTTVTSNSFRGIASEREPHTDTQTHRHTHTVSVLFVKVCFASKQKEKNKEEEEEEEGPEANSRETLYQARKMHTHFLTRAV